MKPLMTERLTSEKSELTIYKIHKHLRSVNNKTYDPDLIAIGPYHHENKDLELLEEHKLRYMKLLLQENGEKFERYVSAIEPLENQARKCYAETISLTTAEFTEMLVLDGCFIIQLVRKFTRKNLREPNDPIFHMEWIPTSLKRDLILFENQIPFFILLKLFDLIVVPNQQHFSLTLLLFKFFSDFYPGKGYKDNISNEKPYKIRHLLELVNRNWLPINMAEGETMKKRRYIDSATELVEANVEFKKAPMGFRKADVEVGTADEIILFVES